jgi:[methyl-Co(III) methanol-specific corrinoid protein]:coenzyme M methyltransferase
MRETILSLLAGQKTETIPAFSGLIHVTQEGLANNGQMLHETHHDAQKLAKAAASTLRLTGMPSAALPLDLCAPAEALGAELNYYKNSEHQFPQPAKSLFPSTKNLNGAFLQSADFISKGRLPVILDAFQRLKEDIGEAAVLSGIIPGPYTLLLYLIEPGGLFTEMKREPNLVEDALSNVSSFLMQVGSAYRNAGADFITIHEMGGSPGFIGPAKFEQFVFPALKKLVSELPKPTVVSVCGNVNRSLHLLNQIEANAISIDQTTDIHAARETLKDTLLFGNLDPVAALWQGDGNQITELVQAAKEAGVNAVWPGCDLVVQTPTQNLATFSTA